MKDGDWRRGRAGGPFPGKWLGVALVTTLGMFAWQGWHVYHSFGVIQMVKEEYVRTEELRDRTIHLDQARTVAATTGEMRWISHYMEVTAQLEAALTMARTSLSHPADAPILERAVVAQQWLQAADRQAFDLVRHGRHDDAVKLLSSDEYTHHHTDFIDAVTSFIAAMHVHLNTQLRFERNKELLSVMVALGTFTVSLAVWLTLLRRLQRWHGALLQEVAERERLQAELRQAQKMEAVGQLADGVAHDFSNLLTAISGYTVLAAKTLPADHRAAKSLDRVQQAAEQAGGVIKALLTFSRKAPVEKSPVELAALVTKTARLLRRMLPASIRLVVDANPARPRWVTADPTQLQQVLMNLVINARDAMPKGGVLRIGLSATPAQDVAVSGEDARARRMVRLTVGDTGAGVPMDLQARIFEPFFTTKPRGEGTGLGLAMVHGIVAEHGGRITFRSEPEVGTVFTVDLPRAAAPAASETAPDRHPLPRGHGERILLAEDYPYVREIIAATLQSAGYQVTQTSDGPALLEQYRRHRTEVQCLVIDVDLPGRSGPDCLEAIRTDGCHAPAILITGTERRELEDSLDANTLVLHKPFQMGELDRLIAKLIDTAAVASRP